MNLDLNLNTNNDLEFNFNMGLLKSKIDSYEYYDTALVIVPEREAAHAPSYTFSLGFEKKYQNMFWGANMEGKDWFYFSDSHNEKSKS